MTTLTRDGVEDLMVRRLAKGLAPDWKLCEWIARKERAKLDYLAAYRRYRAEADALQEECDCQTAALREKYDLAALGAACEDAEVAE